MQLDGAWARAWAGALAHLIDSAHLATGADLSRTVDRSVGPLGLSAEVLMVDLAQQVLMPVRQEPVVGVDVEGTLAGRAYQYGEIVRDDDRGAPQLWVPVLDGTERVGVLRIGLPGRRPSGFPDDDTLADELWTLAGLVGHIVMSKLVHSDRLRRLRSNGLLSPGSELLWQLVPPRTFATDRVVVSAILEPHDTVVGDAYDYSVDGDVVTLAVFDSSGHDIRAGVTSALALTAVRNARLSGRHDLVEVAAHADAVIADQPRPMQFSTAVLARLDTAGGALDYLLAGHPPPLLVRDGRVVKELTAVPRPPLGVTGPDVGPAHTAREQLEPGDRLLLYTDGVTEARDGNGEFFGERRLVELTEQAAAADLSAPETLRRLRTAVMRHQEGRLQDDATLLLVDWASDRHLRMFPAGRPSR